MTQLILDVKDDYVYKFINLLDMLPKDKISIKKDFLCDEINNRIDAIKSGSFSSHDKMWDKIEERLKA